MDKKIFDERNDKNTFSRRIADIRNKTIKIGSVKIDDIENISTSSRALQSVVS